MIYLLAVYVLAVLASLFISSWRAAIWALALEFLVAGAVVARGDVESWSVRIQAADLILFRAVAVPLLLIGALRKFKLEGEFDTIPANFVIWTMALVVVIGSYWFGQKAFPLDLQRSLHLGTAMAGVLAGLFILANQSSKLGQLLGLLTMEAGIVLTEALGTSHERWLIQLGLSAVFVWTIGVIWEFVGHFAKLEGGPVEVVATDGLRVEEGDVL